MQRALTITSLLLAQTLAACGSDVDLDELADELASAMCKKAYDCCSKNELEETGQGAYGSDIGNCANSLAGQFEELQENLERGVEAGRLEYDGEKLGKCLEEYQDTSCKDLKDNARAPTCVYTKPKVDDGGACRLNEECRGGDCDISSSDQPGACRALPGEDEGCDDLCAAGSYCAGICQPTLADGEECRSNESCTTGGCNGYDSETDAPGECGLKGGEGSRCYLTQGCGAGGASWEVALLLGGWAVLTFAARRRRGASPGDMRSLTAR